MTFQQAKRVVVKEFKKYKKDPHLEEGFTGLELTTGEQIVRVTGYTTLLYARVRGMPMILYNDSVMPKFNLPVLIGKGDDNKYLLRVLDFKRRTGVDFDGTYGVGPHHEHHEIFNDQGGDDVVWVQDRQIMPARVQAQTMTVYVYPGYALSDPYWFRVEEREGIDMTDYQPEAGALYALVYVDSDGNIGVRAGETVDDKDQLTTSDIPIPASNETALAAIRLYADQTEIVETKNIRDVIDLRFTGTPGIPKAVSGAIGAAEEELDFAITKLYIDGKTQLVQQNALVESELDFALSKHIVEG